jgi:hypothetical protein
MTLDRRPAGDSRDFLASINTLRNGELSALDLVSRHLNHHLLDNYYEIVAMNLIATLSYVSEHV